MQDELVEIQALKSRQRAEDMRRFQPGQVTPKQLWRENSIWSLGIVKADVEAKGIDESWERIIRNLQDNRKTI